MNKNLYNRKNTPTNMKNLFYIAIGALLISCSPSSDKSELATKKLKLDSLKAVIATLEYEIEELDTTKAMDAIPKVFTQKLESQTFESFVEVYGVVESDQNVVVMPEIAGAIRSIKVHDGQTVKKGQTLAILDTDLIRKNMAEVRNSLDFAIDVFQKQKKLYEQNVGTEMQYLEAKNRKESLERSLNTLEAQLDKAIITSPIDGKIDEIYPKTGELAGPQTPFARIINTSELYINADVSEAFFNKIKVGDDVQVRFPYQGDTLNVKVNYKGNYINPNNRTFKIHCSLTKEKKALPPNLLAVLRLRNELVEKTLVIPNNVIQNDGKNDFVYVVKDEKAHKKVVKTAQTYQVKTVISSGLSVGDMLVTQGYRAISDDVKVEVVK